MLVSDNTNYSTSAKSKPSNFITSSNIDQLSTFFKLTGSRSSKYAVVFKITANY